MSMDRLSSTETVQSTGETCLIGLTTFSSMDFVSLHPGRLNKSWFVLIVSLHRLRRPGRLLLR